jgi:hypothetical protein
MISPASLSAFSASVVPSLPSVRSAGLATLAAARDNTAAQQTPLTSSLGSAVAKPPLSAPISGQRLPRGSLLDLRV